VIPTADAPGVSPPPRPAPPQRPDAANYADGVTGRSARPTGRSDTARSTGAACPVHARPGGYLHHVSAIQDRANRVQALLDNRQDNQCQSRPPNSTPHGNVAQGWPKLSHCRRSLGGGMSHVSRRRTRLRCDALPNLAVFDQAAPLRGAGSGAPRAGLWPGGPARRARAVLAALCR
jgi:hypothetical protein